MRQYFNKQIDQRYLNLCNFFVYVKPVVVLYSVLSTPVVSTEVTDLFRFILTFCVREIKTICCLVSFM